MNFTAIIRWCLIILLIQCFLKLLQSEEIGYFPNSNFKSYEKIGPKGCAKECLRHSRCASFNYDKENFYCELNDRIAGKGELLIEKYQNFVYKETEEIPSKLLEACASSNCPIHTKCIQTMKKVTCVPIGCGSPPLINNGSVPNDDVYQFDDNVTYNCNNGFKLLGSRRTIRCMRNGQWTESDVICGITCQSPVTEVPYVVIKPGKNDIDLVGDVRKLACQKYYYPASGNDYITCVGNGTWTDVELVCRGCGKPPSLARATVPAGDSRIGTTLNYTCKDGYKSSARSKEILPYVICEKNGKWSDFRHNCSIYGCGPPKTYNNTVTPHGTSYIGDYRNYTCKVGFKQPGEGYVMCNSNAKWTEIVTPNCSHVDCGNPPNYHGAVVNNGTTLFNQQRTYFCDVGYKSGNIETPYVKCRADRTWKEVVKPICISKCPAIYQWDKDSRMCFKATRTGMTWYAANETCLKTQKGTLVRLDSNVKLQTIKKHLSGFRGYWVQLPGGLSTINIQKQTCSFVQKNAKELQYSNCLDKKFYICEIKL